MKKLVILVGLFYISPSFSMVKKPIKPSVIKIIPKKFVPLIERIKKSRTSQSKKLLFQLFSELPIDLQNEFLVYIIEGELAQSWSQEDIPDKLNKFLLAYLPAQIHITQKIKNNTKEETTEKKYILTDEQIKKYLKLLDYKITQIVKKRWHLSPTFLVTMFYNGNDKEEIIALLQTKGKKKQQKELSATQENTIEQLEHTYLPHRKSVLYQLLIGEKPKNIVQETLISLQRQGLTDNDVAIFTAIPSVQTAETLDLASNQLNTLYPNNFNQLTHLKRLALDKNKIESIQPYAFKELTHLEQLILQHNHITHIDENAFNGLSSLQRLSLYDNQIASLGNDAFTGLTNLRELDLSHNKLDDTSFDVTVFENLPSLRILRLENNKFSDKKKREIRNIFPVGVKIYF